MQKAIEYIENFISDQIKLHLQECQEGTCECRGRNKGAYPIYIYILSESVLNKKNYISSS